MVDIFFTQKGSSSRILHTSPTYDDEFKPIICEARKDHFVYALTLFCIALASSHLNILNFENMFQKFYYRVVIKTDEML